MAIQVINSLTFGDTYVFTTPYATSSTAAEAVAKVATLTPNSNFKLETGVRVIVKFTNANTASSPTLNVNNSGAKTIQFRGAAITSSLYRWAANSVVEFMYDGTYWQMLGAPNNTNSTYTVSDKKITLSAGTGLSGGGDFTLNQSTDESISFALADSGVTANSYGPSANATPAHSGTFSVPYITVDRYGRVTAASTKTITLPSSGNTDQKVKQTNSTTSNYRALLLGTSHSSTVDDLSTEETGQAYKTSNIVACPSTGEIKATTFSGALNGNASTATKATKDSAGNIITSTYMTKLDPTGTGSFSLNRKEGTTVGEYSVAIGENCTASSKWSYAEGSSTQASNIGAHAEGGYSVASGNCSHAEGGYTESSGTCAHAEGRNTIASGNCAHAEGGGGQAIHGDNTTTILRTIASGDYSHAEGTETTASGHASHSEGANTVASNDYSHAEGYKATASGFAAHAEGGHSVASGSFSHAEGEYTEASGDYSHAEGGGYMTYDSATSTSVNHYATASGQCSHAEGCGTVASGDYSHSEGHATTASGNWSHAGGFGTIASQECQTSIGKYNKENDDALFIVGNGTNNKPSNALEVLQDGTVNATTFVGNLTGTATKATQDGNGNVITSTYIKKPTSFTALGKNGSSFNGLSEGLYAFECSAVFAQGEESIPVSVIVNIRNGYFCPRSTMFCLHTKLCFLSFQFNGLNYRPVLNTVNSFAGDTSELTDCNIYYCKLA